MSRSYVFSYVNPDTDGACSSIAYAYYLNKAKNVDTEPVVFGTVDAETKFVLSYLKIPHPNTLVEVNPDNKYYIVDTHHVNSLPSGFPLSSVVEILDHHPTGDASAFPNAEICNEKIGAVATLVTERIRISNTEPNSDIATLLFAAIISNTLGFKAPTTTDRDREAVNWLKQFFTLPNGFTDSMFEARSDIGQKSTMEVVLSDFKEFDFSGVKVGIAQIETINLEDFLQRKDISLVLDTIRQQNELDHILINGANIKKETGALITPTEKTRNILKQIVSGTRFTNDIAYLNRILLRKSDLVPQFKEYFAAQ